MDAEVISPEQIVLTPDCALEDAVISRGHWIVQIREPEPLEFNVRQLILSKLRAAPSPDPDTEVEEDETENDESYEENPNADPPSLPGRALPVFSVSEPSEHHPPIPTVADGRSYAQ